MICFPWEIRVIRWNIYDFQVVRSIYFKLEVLYTMIFLQFLFIFKLYFFLIYFHHVSLVYVWERRGVGGVLHKHKRRTNCLNEQKTHFYKEDEDESICFMGH